VLKRILGVVDALSSGEVSRTCSAERGERGQSETQLTLIDWGSWVESLAGLGCVGLAERHKLFGRLH
jgi:hypothetical protein